MRPRRLLLPAVTAVLAVAAAVLMVQTWDASPPGSEQPAGTSRPPPVAGVADGENGSDAERAWRVRRQPADTEGVDASRWFVTGTVTSAADEQPVAGARVRVCVVGTRVLREDTPREPLGACETDANGAYRLEVPELAARPAVARQYLTVVTRADAEGFLWGRWLPSPRGPPTDDGIRIDHQLQEGVGISGRVLDVDGGPAPAASVVLVDAVGETYEQVTDAQGRYYFDVEPEAPSIVRLGAAQARLGIAPEARVRVVPDELVRAPDLVLGNAAGTIAGTVRFADGTPVDRLRINMQYMGAEKAGQDVGHEPPDSIGLLAHETETNVLSDELGRFSARTLHPGRYRLSYDETDDETGFDGVFAAFEVATGTNDLTITVSHARLDVRLLDESGRELVDSPLSALAWEGDAAKAASSAFESGRTVSASLRERAAHGAIGLRAYHLRRFWVRWGSYVAAESFDRGVLPALASCWVPPGTATQQLDITLRRDPSPGWVRLAVARPDGTPVTDYRWNVRLGVVGPIYAQAWQPAPAEGRVGPFPSGRVVLEVDAGKSVRQRGPGLFLRVEHEVVVPPGGVVDVALTARPAVRLALKVRRLGGPEESRRYRYRCVLRRLGRPAAAAAEHRLIDASGRVLGALEVSWERQLSCLARQEIEPGSYAVRLELRGPGGTFAAERQVDLDAGDREVALDLVAR